MVLSYVDSRKMTTSHAQASLKLWPLTMSFISKSHRSAGIVESRRHGQVSKMPRSPNGIRIFSLSTAVEFSQCRFTILAIDKTLNATWKQRLHFAGDRHNSSFQPRHLLSNFYIHYRRDESNNSDRAWKAPIGR